MKWVIIALLVLHSAFALTLTVDSPSENSVYKSVDLVAHTDEDAFIIALRDGQVFATSTGKLLNASLPEGTFDLSVIANLTTQTVTVVNGTNITNTTVETANFEISNVTVDSTRPVASISSPTSGQKAVVKPSSSLNVIVSVTEPNMKNGLLILQRTDGTFVSSAVVIGSGTIQLSVPQDVAGFTELWLNLTVTDTAGNSRSVREQSVLVDFQPPSVSVSKPDSNVFTDGPVTVEYQYSDAHPDRARIELMNGSTAIDSQDVSFSAGGTHTRTDLVDFDAPTGKYRLRVTVYDKVGQSFSDTSDEVIVFDSEKPSVSFSLGGTVFRVGDTITPVCNVSDNSQSWGGNVTKEISGIESSYAHTRTAYCHAEDAAGNKETVLVEYTVLPKYSNSTSNTVVTTNITARNITANTTVDTTSVIQNTTTQEASAVEAARAMRERLNELSAATTVNESVEEIVESDWDDAVKKLWPYAVTVLGLVVVVVLVVTLGRPRKPRTDPGNWKIPVKDGPSITQDPEDGRL